MIRPRHPSRRKKSRRSGRRQWIRYPTIMPWARVSWRPAGGKAFIIQSGQLAALNVQTGARVWKFGSGLQAPLLYRSGVLYAASKTGAVYAINASNGKKVWASQAASQGAVQLVTDGERLLVNNGDIQTYGLKDGKLLWRVHEENGFIQPIVAEDGLVLGQNSVSGAYTYDILHAYDAVTGKQLWKAANHDLPAAVKDGTVISQREGTLVEAVDLTSLDILDGKTGKVLKTVIYNPQNVNLKDQGPGAGNFPAWYSGNRIYLNAGNKLYSYPADADPAKTTRDTYSVESVGFRDLVYAAGPYDERILFTNNSGLYGVKTTDKSTVYYGGLRNDIARFDLIGHGLYIIQTDGRLIAMHLCTAIPVVQLKTGGNVFGPSLSVNGMIIVQSKGKVQAFKEPDSLKMK
ncbi:PQQ-binding-like beta-propeller repeat protein [Paenibacillus sophorae]|uniref:outer membrane protein assembly factor BamB family protein n=1 Tax=Paenibacillus sophorae TaxID=1333845 RepID=UPI000B83DC4C